MRRRFGAFHSDSVEDFEKLAQQGLNIPLFYYNFVEAGAESSEAVSDDMDTEDSQHDEVTSSNYRVLVVDLGGDEETTEELRRLIGHCAERRELDYFCWTKMAGKNQEVRYHVWVNDSEKTRYPRIVDEYSELCDQIVYIGKGDCERTQNRRKLLPPIRVVRSNKRRVSSCEQLAGLETAGPKALECQSLLEALERIHASFL